MKIKMAQINPIIGDLEGNTNKILSIIEMYKYENIDLLVFPETCITGYPPKDLLERSGFIEKQLECVDRIIASTRRDKELVAAYKNNQNIDLSNKQLNVVFGAFTFNNSPGKPLYNTLFVVRNGEVILKYNKVCLPTYNIFDEYRYTEPGDPHQDNVLVIGGKIVAFLICEDALSHGSDTYKTDPVSNIFKRYASIDCLVTINASPSNFGKFSYRYDVYSKICKKHSISAIYVNQVGANDDIIFDGQSFIMNKQGQLIEIKAPLKECFSTIKEVNNNQLTECFLPNHMNYSKNAFIYEHLVLGIKDFFHKQGFKKALVGCSGGIDSAVVLALAVRALGNENVEAITMPSNISSHESVSDSELLCKNLNIKLTNFYIGDLYNVFFNEFYSIYGNTKPDVTEQNLQARLRANILYAHSNKFGGLVLNTSNKTELSVGYGTLYGDLSGSLSVIGDVYKMDVFSLARYINYIDGNVIPNTIIDKEPSAELAPGQKDSDDLPEYPILDAICKLYIEGNHLSDEEILINKSLLSTLSDKETIEKILKKIDSNDFKRNQGCPILRVSLKAFGTGRRIPIAKKVEHIAKNIFNKGK